MVKLRLRRAGKKKQPVYKIVVADSREARTGKSLEDIGIYNPRTNPMLIEINEPRLFAWLRRGAQPTDTLRSLLQRKGLWLKWGLMKKGADEAKIVAEFEKWQMMQSEKLARETEKKDRRKKARRKKAVSEAAPAPAEVVPSAAEAVPAVAEAVASPAA